MESINRLAVFALALTLASCSPPAPDASRHAADGKSPGAESGQAAGSRVPGRSVLTPGEQGLPTLLAPVSRPWIGDFDGMAQRRLVRILTVYQTGGYFLDGPQEKGLTYDLAREFEEFLNERLGTGHLKLHVVLIPVEFDQLIDALLEGYGDVVAAGLAITPERLELVDFSEPLSREVNEVIVTGPAAPPLATLDDLAGQEVFARSGSSFQGSLRALGRQLAERGLPNIGVRDAPRSLDDVELLEMVSAGLLPMVVMDDFKARFWAGIFDAIQVREELAIRSGQRLAWAIRKNSPLLRQEVDEFARTHRQGTLVGNVLLNRYLKDTAWVKSALDPGELPRFKATIELFERYGSRYGFDPLLLAAQGYQESRLDQSMRSPAGAVGIMQLLPSTAADPNVGIHDIETADANVHAGAKYLKFIRDRYFGDLEGDSLNQTLFAFAAYNAGPARVRDLRGKAAEAGLDPDTWFQQVEIMAAREIGRETVQYVSNIYKYYLAYHLLVRRAMPDR